MRKLALVSVAAILLGSGCSTRPVPTPMEHVAIRVPDPGAFVAWWTGNLGFHVTMKRPGGSAFIADSNGHVAFEVYGPDKDHPAPDYRAADILRLHFGFTSEDVDADIRRLVDAGAKLEIHNVTSGFEEAVLRDPFGLVIQLVKRERSVLK